MGKPRLVEGIRGDGTKFNIFINLGLYYDGENTKFLAFFLPLKASHLIKRNSSEEHHCLSDEECIVESNQNGSGTKILTNLTPLFTHILNHTLTIEILDCFSDEDINTNVVYDKDGQIVVCIFFSFLFYYYL